LTFRQGRAAAPLRRRTPIASSATIPPLPPGASPRRLAGSRVRVSATENDGPLTRDWFRLAMLALVVETISKVASFIGPLALFRPALALFLISVLFALVNPSRAITPGLFRFAAPKWILFQAVIACGSAVFGISLGHSALFIINVYSKTIVIALLLMASLRGVGDVRRLVWATAFGGILLAFVSLFVVHISKEQGAQGYDANDVGLIVVTTLPLVLLVMQTSKRLGKVTAIVGAVLIAATIVQTASRGAFIGAAMVGLTLFFFVPGVSILKRAAAGVVIVAVMAQFAPSGYWQSIQNIISDPTADYNWDSVNGRRQIAKRGLGYIAQYPVFGLGIGNFEMAEGTISPYAQEVAGTDVGVKWSAPHNSWLQAAAETGPVGLLAWAALVVGSSVALLRLRRRMPKSWAKSGTPDERFLYLSTLYVPIAFLGFVVCGSFVSFAWSDQSYVLPAIALGIQRAFEVKMGHSLPHANGVSPAARRGSRLPQPTTA